MKAMEGIRTAKETDAEEILRIYAPIITETPISFEYALPSIAEISTRIADTLTQYPWLVCEQQGRVVGYAYARAYRARAAYQWSAEVSVYVDSEFYGKGIGKTLYRALFAILRQQGYRTVIGGITLPNAASVGIHESLGFKPAGVFKALGYKLGAWHDVGFWQLDLQPSTIDPVPPVPFSLLKRA